VSSWPTPALYKCQAPSTNRTFRAKQTQSPKPKKQPNPCPQKGLRIFRPSRKRKKQTQTNPIHPHPGAPGKLPESWNEVEIPILRGRSAAQIPIHRGSIKDRVSSIQNLGTKWKSRHVGEASYPTYHAITACIMQNKPNPRSPKNNATPFTAKNYEEKPLPPNTKKQTQFIAAKPIGEAGSNPTCRGAARPKSQKRPCCKSAEAGWAGSHPYPNHQSRPNSAPIFHPPQHNIERSEIPISHRDTKPNPIPQPF